MLLADLKKFYAKNKRDLPWRKTHDPYKILVSEVMLQQTQVERVIPKYNLFIKTYPKAKDLAKAPLREVLSLWSGLGYNRRAKYLHEAAKVIAKDGWGGRLPGVGPYTKAAVEAFAYNKPGVFIETNIRTVYTHFYFLNKNLVSDIELLPLIERDLKKSKMQPRDFYAALMDYGSYLKKSGVKINSKSKHYIKQSKFEGSNRQIRGAILRELLKKPQTLEELVKNFAHAKKYAFIKRNRAARILVQLVRDGLVNGDQHGRYRIVD